MLDYIIHPTYFFLFMHTITIRKYCNKYHQVILMTCRYYIQRDTNFPHNRNFVTVIMMESIWSKSANIKEHSPLSGDISTDALVLGAGMAGILIAYKLQAAGVNTVVIEADRIASGQTKNTTAKITSQHGIIYDKLIQSFGAEKAKMYADANQKAIGSYRELISALNIDCDLTKADAYIYTTENDITAIKKEAQAAMLLGIDAEYKTKTELPLEVRAAVKFADQAYFNPIKFLAAVSEGLTVYEKTKAISVEKETVLTDRGRIKAKYIIFATHFPFINSPGYYFLRMHQERSYVLALKNARPTANMYVSIDKEGLSFRPYGEFLIFGGMGHKTGDRNAPMSYEILQKYAKKYYPESSVYTMWSAQDCRTLDQVPYIGQFSASTPNMYVATGFDKWGMTTSMVSAEIITDAITGKQNKNAEIFDPQRFNFTASIKDLATNTIESARGLMVELFSIPPEHAADVKPGEGKIVEAKGHKVGVYRDNDGKLHWVSTKCTHLGCQLEWNPNELSWDCPCHGSRFDYKGNLINNPTIRNIKLNKSEK